MSTNGPLLGYNNNIPYKGRVYHVQTEDSGAKRPHVITHLFADGGRIVNTTKTSYADLVGGDNLADKVRALMREQHRGMVVSLRDGEFDSLIDIDPSVEAPVAEEEAEVARVQDTAPTSEPLELVRTGRRTGEVLASGAGSYKKIVGRASGTMPDAKSPPGSRSNLFRARRTAATRPHATGGVGGGALFGHAIRSRPGRGVAPVIELHGDTFGQRYLSERSFDELVATFFGA